MRILREPKHQLCSCGHLFSWKIQALYTTTYWPASPDDKQELKKGNSLGEGRKGQNIQWYMQAYSVHHSQKWYNLYLWNSAKDPSKEGYAENEWPHLSSILGILNSPFTSSHNKIWLQYQCLNELISYWEMKSQSIWESGFRFSWIGDHMIRLVACLLLEQVSLSFFLMSLLHYSTSSCCSSSMFVHGLHCNSL